MESLVLSMAKITWNQSYQIRILYIFLLFYFCFIVLIVHNSSNLKLFHCQLFFWRSMFFFVFQLLHKSIPHPLETLNTSQCRNFRIFLSFTFYVKSVLKNLEVLKFQFFAIWGALNFAALMNFSLQKVQKSKKVKVQSL